MHRWLALALAVAAVGCGGADPTMGMTAYLRATNAQFVPGPLPADTDPAGPAVSDLSLPNTKVRPGLTGAGFSGTVVDGRAVLFGLVGDQGYWITTATAADPVVTNGYTFSASLSFSPAMPNADQVLEVHGVSPEGVIGPAQTMKLTTAAFVAPPGSLVFTLTWDTNADLDLHVVMPNPMANAMPDPTMPDPIGDPRTIEVWSKSPTALPPNPEGWDSATVDAAGKIPFDSNANCVIDGVRQENLIFPLTTTPPAGEYIVRVDAFSMCGQAAAQWRVDVTTPDGPWVNPATWEATDADARGLHRPGSGRLALDFMFP
jgi:hypothetical protein